MGMKTKLYFSVASTILFAIVECFLYKWKSTKVVLVMYFLCFHYTKYSATKKNKEVH